MRLLRPLAAVLLAGSLLPLSAASADTGPQPLGMTTVADVVLDEARGHLFLSPGSSGSGVRVTDLAGTPVAVVDGLPAATGMALTPDGTSLWVALPTVGALARINTATLTVAQTISVPTGQCPGDVAVVGDRLVYGHSCNTYAGTGGYGGLGVVDPATGAHLGGVTSGPYYKPFVAAATPGLVYAADAGLSPTSLSLYDVTGGTPVLVASRAQVCENLRDLSARPDGAQVVTACGSPYRHDVYSVDKLATVGLYPSDHYPLAGAWSADGGTFAAGTDSAYDTDVRVFPTDASTPTRAVDFGSGETLQPRGLAVSADGSRVWAVTRTATGAAALRVLDVPGTPNSALTLAADPPDLVLGSTTMLGGWLSSSGVGIAGTQLTVERRGLGASATLLPVTTRTDGTYVFKDSPPQAGDYDYVVTWPGDGTRPAATATARVTVRAPSATLQLSLERGTDASGVAGTARLSYTGASAGGRTVRLERTAGGTTTALPSVTTDVYGVARFLDRPPAGDVTYTATVDAHGAHPAVTATAATTVLRATTLTATTAASTPIGTPASVTGRLTAATGGVPSGLVVVQRAGCGTWTGSTTTSATGAWTLTDPAPALGTCTYTASFAGGGGFAPTTTSTSTSVVKRTGEVTLTVTRGTGSTKKNAYVTAQLGGWHTNRVVTITAQPVKGKEVVLASGPVDAAGVLTAVYQPKTTTTYRVRYDGDAWYTPASAERTQ